MSRHNSSSNALHSIADEHRADAWVRLPKPKSRFCGLSRTTILELCETGAVKSTLIRKRHAMRGIRLVYVPSLLRFLDANARGGAEGASL